MSAFPKRKKKGLGKPRGRDAALPKADLLTFEFRLSDPFFVKAPKG